jgi:hypothetical protein
MVRVSDPIGIARRFATPPNRSELRDLGIHLFFSVSL